MSGKMAAFNSQKPPHELFNMYVTFYICIICKDIDEFQKYMGPKQRCWGPGREHWGSKIFTFFCFSPTLVLDMRLRGFIYDVKQSLRWFSKSSLYHFWRCRAFLSPHDTKNVRLRKKKEKEKSSIGINNMVRSWYAYAALNFRGAKKKFKRKVANC